MSRVGAVFSVFFSLLILHVTPNCLFAQWSFTFGDASNQYFYGRYGQIGSNGFFGPYDVDNSVLPLEDLQPGDSQTGNFASLNGWSGNRNTDLGELVSGTDVSVSQLTVGVKGRIGMEWITVKGLYLINAYEAASTQGAFEPISPGQLTTWSADIDTPLFTITFGKQIFQNGLGLQFSFNRTQEYILFSRSYEVPNFLGWLVNAGMLPRRVLSWFNPTAWNLYREPEEKEAEQQYTMYADPTGFMKWMWKPQTDEDDIPDVDDPYTVKDPKDEFPGRKTRLFRGGHYGPGSLIVGYGIFPWQRIGGITTFNQFDLNAAFTVNYLLYFMYHLPELTIGIGGLRTFDHLGPELQPSTFLRDNTPVQDTYIAEGWAFLKYSNGSFFFNTELDWFNRLIRFQRTADGIVRVRVPDQPEPVSLPEFIPEEGFRSRFAPQYRESWRFLAEAGYLYRHVRASVMYAFMPGPDRRHGMRIDRQPFIQQNEQASLGVFENYSILLSFFYGGGVDAPAHLSDAAVYAVRMDYALAANLWLEGSLLAARRTSHGYGWGYIRPNPTLGSQFGSVDYNVRGNYLIPSPAIPDNDLGWEVTAGATWKLMEGLGTQFRVAYWQPGRWFNFACIDRSVPNWNTPTPANNFGINPNRTIDPVVGFEMRISGTF